MKEDERNDKKEKRRIIKANETLISARRLHKLFVIKLLVINVDTRCKTHQDFFAHISKYRLHLTG